LRKARFFAAQPQKMRPNPHKTGGAVTGAKLPEASGNLTTPPFSYLIEAGKTPPGKREN
jgi:hypothetical protein